MANSPPKCDLEHKINALKNEVSIAKRLVAENKSDRDMWKGRYEQEKLDNENLSKLYDALARQLQSEEDWAKTLFLRLTRNESP